MSALEETVRPLVEPERRLLKSKISSLHRRRKRYRGRLVTVALVLWAGGSGLTLLASRVASDWHIILLVWAGIAASIAAWLLLEERSRSSARTHSFEDALRRDQAHVIRIRSRSEEH